MWSGKDDQMTEQLNQQELARITGGGAPPAPPAPVSATASQSKPGNVSQGGFGPLVDSGGIVLVP